MIRQQMCRYDRTGLLALDPQALGLEFLIGGKAEGPELLADGAVAVVDVSGPLTFDSWIFQSYGQVRDSVIAALGSEASTVVLRINSPGGDVWGSFDCARAIRAAADAAGKKLIAWVPGQACSAAYALAAACDSIIVSDTAVVGSIGVIAVACEMSAANERAGVKFSVITSGERKADGHPAIPVTDGALAAMRQSVDAMAAVFFEHVHARRGLDPQPLEASTFVGGAAIVAGLADGVSSFEALIGDLASGAEIPSGGAMGVPMAKSSKDATRSAILEAIADDSDKEKCQRAKRALAAWDGDEPESEGDAPPPKDEEEKPAEASEEEKPEAAAADEKEKPAAVAAVAAQVPTAAEVAKLVAEELDRKAKADAVRAEAARTADAFYASRPDLSPELVKRLRAMPLETAQAVAAAIPLPDGSFSNPLVVSPKATVGKGLESGSSNSNDPDLKAAFSRGEIKATVKQSARASTFSLVGDDDK